MIPIKNPTWAIFQVGWVTAFILDGRGLAHPGPRLPTRSSLPDGLRLTCEEDLAFPTGHKDPPIFDPCDRDRVSISLQLEFEDHFLVKGCDTHDDVAFAEQRDDRNRDRVAAFAGAVAVDLGNAL